jgi:excisionase family DNA binding protein
VDLRQAAQELGVHYQTAYGWVRDGTLSARKLTRSYEVDRGAVDALLADRARPRRRGPTRVRDWGAQVESLVSLLRAGDELGARAQLQRLDGVDSVTVGDCLIGPALHRIGLAWEAGELSVAEEHRAAAICERLLARRVAAQPGRPRGVAVVATPPREGHGLPALMAAAALRADHWRVNHLGVGVPPDDLVLLAAAVRADVAVLPVTMPDAAPAAERLAARLRKERIPTLVGRPGATLDELVESARAVTPLR